MNKQHKFNYSLSANSLVYGRTVVFSYHFY